MKILIDIAGQNDKRTELADIPATGATVQAIAEAAGLDTKDKDFSVNGQPAGLDRHIGPADVQAAKEKGAAVLSISARPVGS